MAKKKYLILLISRVIISTYRPREGQLWIGRDLQLFKKLKITEKYLPESTILGNTGKEASPL